MVFEFEIPLMAILYSNFGFKVEHISVLIGTPFLFYLFSSLFIYILTDKMQKRGLMLIGLLVVSLSMLLIGSYSRFPEESDERYIVVIVGTCTLGLASALVNIPALPELLLTYEEDEYLKSLYT